MTLFVFSNNAVGFLRGTITETATTLSIEQEDTLKFAQPSASPAQVLRAMLTDDTEAYEIIDISANPRTGDMTIIRARESTPARVWPAGAKLEAVITAGIMAQFAADIETLKGE